MHRYALEADSAFSLLIRSSSHANIKLRIVAERLVSAANAKAAETWKHTRAEDPPGWSTGHGKTLGCPTASRTWAETLRER